MHPPPPPGLLTASARSAQRLAAALSGAIDTAVDLPCPRSQQLHTTTSQPHHAHTNRRPDPSAVCPSSQARRRRTPSSAGYSPCMRAVRHGVGRGAGTKLPDPARRRAGHQSGRQPPGCRGTPSPGYRPGSSDTIDVASRSCRHAGECKSRRPDTMTGSPRHSGAAGQQATIIGTVRRKSGGQLRRANPGQFP
jgi:hypothetical protein